MLLLKDIKESFLHFLFPHVCEGCGTDVLDEDHFLCLQCGATMPKTDFHFYPNNPVEKTFWGRIPVTAATAQYYFTKESMMQHLLHQLKYRGHKELGLYLGRLMGHALASSNRFRYIDVLLPLPLFPTKERTRGYNQATVLCEGIADVLQKPIAKDAVIRTIQSESQTKKSRIDRWLNMEGKFELKNSAAIEGKRVLLVDDVITTGATLEACGGAILQAQNVQLSLAALCFSSR
jgi:ComF family protein